MHVLTVSITISIAAYGKDGLVEGLIANNDVDKTPATAISVNGPGSFITRHPYFALFLVFFNVKI